MVWPNRQYQIPLGIPEQEVTGGSVEHPEGPHLIHEVGALTQGKSTEPLGVLRGDESAPQAFCKAGIALLFDSRPNPDGQPHSCQQLLEVGPLVLPDPRPGFLGFHPPKTSENDRAFGHGEKRKCEFGSRVAQAVLLADQGEQHSVDGRGRRARQRLEVLPGLWNPEGGHGHGDVETHRVNLVPPARVT